MKSGDQPSEKFSDEILMAYADGEVDDALRAQIDAAIATDPHIAAVVEQHRRLRAQLGRAFDDELSAAIPDRLLATLTAPTFTAANVISLPDRAPQRWRWREWGALAATFVLGVSLGFALLQRDSGLVATEHGALLAHSALASALSEQLASAQRGSEPVQIGISFTARSGHYCRTFAVPRDNLAGVACRDGGSWRVQMLTESGAVATTTYRQAGSAMPLAVLNLVEQQIAGDPLDAAAEVQAQRAGWQR